MCLKYVLLIAEWGNVSSTLEYPQIMQGHALTKCSCALGQKGEITNQTR